MTIIYNKDGKKFKVLQSKGISGRNYMGKRVY